MEKPVANNENATQDDSLTATHAGHQRVDSASAALHGGIDKLAEPARHAVDRLSGAAHETIDKLSSSAAQSADFLSERADRISQGPKHALDGGAAWIQEKPLQAVGLALLLGLLVGRLTAR